MEIFSAILVYILLLIPLILELLYDIDLIKVKHRSPKHNTEFLMRLGVITGIAFLIKVISSHGFVGAFLMSSGLHFLFFDYIMNRLLGEPIWYIGSEKYHYGDWFYKVQKMLYGYPMLFFKLWFMCVALGVWIKPEWVGLEWVLF